MVLICPCCDGVYPLGTLDCDNGESLDGVRPTPPGVPVTLEFHDGGPRVELAVDTSAELGRAPGAVGHEAAGDRDTVSRSHAEIRVPPYGPPTVRDLGSRNGTALNDRLVPADRAEPLADGDLIRLGPDVSVTVRVPAAGDD